MKYFNLFSNILISKGATRVIISDPQRNISELVHIELFTIIEELKSISIEDFLRSYDGKSKRLAQQYIDFLIDKEYGFITEKDWDRNFSPMSYNYDDYSTISNVFIEIDNISIIENIKSSVENLGIKHLVIFTHKKLSVEDFILIDSIFINSSLVGIDIFSSFHMIINKEFIKKINLQTSRIYNLVFFNCEQVPFTIKDEFRFAINFVKEIIKINSCGKVDLKYFSTNLPKVLEAINHNSCLHKKIGIDINGNIKNCPAMPDIYGNLKENTLEETLNRKGFKKYWNLTKNDIEICKDCEFRYICTDCRAYTERTHKNNEGLDISKPLKCGYDPYTGEWKEWSKNPLKEKAIEFYGLQDLIKK